MSEQTRKMLNYTVACIGGFARKKKMTQHDAFMYLDRYQGIAFLEACYDLTRICRNNGGNVL